MDPTVTGHIEPLCINTAVSLGSFQKTQGQAYRNQVRFVREKTFNRNFAYDNTGIPSSDNPE